MSDWVGGRVAYTARGIGKLPFQDQFSAAHPYKCLGSSGPGVLSLEQ